MARESGGGGGGGGGRSKRETKAGAFFTATLVMWTVSVFFEILFNKRSELIPIPLGFVFFQSANAVVRRLVSRDPLFVNTCISLLHSSITSAIVVLILLNQSTRINVDKMFEHSQLVEAYWPLAYQALCFSSGYFAYDQLDMLLYRLYSGLIPAILVHHLVLLVCFTLALYRKVTTRPPFDIHKYGERVIDKLSKKGGDDANKALSFGDVVKGQQKHDVARTFSALLQLVNNGDVDLVLNGQKTASTCHSDANPFYVRLLKNERKKGILLQSSKKRAKSPVMKVHGNAKSRKGKENLPAVSSSPQGSNSSFKLSVSLGKQSRSRCTPDGKKRRKSRLVAPLDMNFVG